MSRNKCEHNKRKDRCVDCGGNGICEHNKHKYNCKECKGNGICEHNNRKVSCKECKGSSICAHNKHKYNCKECKGSCICEHNRVKSKCKECKGSSICAHNREKYNCKECKGNGICEHNKYKYNCKECKGNGICEHNRIKSGCKECKGSSFCNHNKEKSRCKLCKGSGVCEHNKRKSRCVDCSGSDVCNHNRQKSHCKECKGSSICEHNTRKLRCIICNPQIACPTCKSVIPNKISRFYPHCSRCYFFLNPTIEIPKRYKIRENYLMDEFRIKYPELKLIFDKTIDGGCSARRPDLRLELLTHSLIVECDEHQHKNTSCENKRMMELFQDLGSRPIVFIRFNPDSYISNNEKHTSCFKQTKLGVLSLNKKDWNIRIKQLLELFQYHIDNIPNQEVTIKHLFYNAYCLGQPLYGDNKTYLDFNNAYGN